MATKAASGDEVLIIGERNFQPFQKQLRKPDYKPPLEKANKVPRTVANYRISDGNIAAIDFGTTSVSLAYTTKGDEKINTVILDAQEKTARDSNAVLLKREGKKITVEAFGNTARSRFTVMRKAGDYNSKYIYFERIKMLLRREKVSYSYTPLVLIMYHFICRMLIGRHWLSHFLVKSFIWLKSLHLY